MEVTGRILLAVCALYLPALVLELSHCANGDLLDLYFRTQQQGQTCMSPAVKSKVYTTTEATASTETVFIVQFNVECKNGAKNLNMYADINGKTLVVTTAEEGSTYQYQVSYSDEHKMLPSGSYDIKFYDEEGYSNLRKAQRSGEGTASISSLFTITVDHPGVWKGPMVQSEFVAAMVAILVWYIAYSAKAKLQSS